MKDYLIRLAINYPHVYPWEREKSRGLLLLSKEEIDNILLDEELNFLEKRREVGWRIQKIMYMNAVHSKNSEDLKEKIGKDFMGLNYRTKILPIDLINETLKRKKLLNERELELYKKFIAGKLTEHDYNNKAVCVQTWLTDLLAMYYFTRDNCENVDKADAVKFITSTIEGRFHSERYRETTINDYLMQAGYNSKSVIQLYRKLFILEHKDFTILMKNVLTFESKMKAETKKIKLDSFLDEISQLIGVKEEDSSKVDSSIVEKDLIHKEKSIVVEVSNLVDRSVIEKVKEHVVEKEKTEEKNDESEYEKLMSKYEALVNTVEKEKQILENKMYDFLRKLVAPEEGAVLSELYGLYLTFEKTDKANIGAALSNFFNKLMLMGLEAKEDGKKEGDKVKFHSSELLKTYRVLRAINQEGNIEGTIKYVGWDYAGKTLMQPVVRVDSK